MKMVRRDQSISPSDISNTRKAPVMNEVVRGAGVSLTAVVVAALTASCSLFDTIA
jgi:hypothetical protein